MNIHMFFAKAIIALAGFISAVASATTPILFNPIGAGTGGGQVTVGTFDWVPANALSVGGNPPNGITAGSKMIILGHSKLVMMFAPDGTPIPVPNGTEFTFVHGFPVTVLSVTGFNSPAFTLDPAPAVGTPNFFEIWVSTPDSDMLAGTGFNNSHRILFGQVTGTIGSLATQAQCNGGGATAQFDQFPSVGDNDYPGVTTVCGVGGTSISVQVISADIMYFPDFTPTTVATLIALFNTSNITPFQQANPSHLFVDDSAGFNPPLIPGASIAPNLGAVNGGLQSNATLDFQNQADANQSFQQGTVVPGACRVTYGGNDKNGNIDPNKFGSACSSDKGNKQNCYTFGGQVGAPTANPAFGGPFGEHTHHNVSGPAGDFVFHAGTHSAPKSTRITGTACKDPGACRQAEANAGFKQIDFEGTGSFRTLDATATAYLASQAGHPVLPDNQDSQIYYFRVDMDDTGEPGNKASKNQFDQKACSSFFAADQNSPLSTSDPLLNNYAACNACADVYQFYICKDQNSCEEKNAIYAVRGFLTGGNIQLHQVIK
jgi:hypothetical protein